MYPSELDLIRVLADENRKPDGTSDYDCILPENWPENKKRLRDSTTHDQDDDDKEEEDSDDDDDDEDEEDSDDHDEDEEDSDDDDEDEEEGCKKKIKVQAQEAVEGQTTTQDNVEDQSG